MGERNIFLTTNYGISDTDKVPIIQYWMDRKGL